MNAAKWRREERVGRMVAHLAQTATRPQLAGVLAHLLEGLETSPRRATLLRQLVDCAQGRGHPWEADAIDALDRRGEAGDFESFLLADLITAVSRADEPRHARRAAESLANALSRELGGSQREAEVLLADRLREVPELPVRPDALR